ncbi:MAG: saccharopine dehydrogenase NADP-binding domain-containing protein, partial [Elusimicrobia bacterium]|nr:saccharopine dehydrogenase NADP-binding domain-containing protein [Elusimicrobiota bacterium]
DLACFGDAAEILLADPDGALAKEAAARVTKLAKASKAKIKAGTVNPERKADLAKALKGRQAVLSALPPAAGLAVAQAALQAKAHYCDCGSNFETARAILKLAPAAQKARVSLIPDCGLAPGLSSGLAMSAMARLDFVKEVRVYVGALPQQPCGPMGHATMYPVETLLALYLEPAVVLRRGKIANLPSLTESELIDIPGVGKLEACLTGGGKSTCPYSFEKRLACYEHKTLRYPGHFEKMAALRAMGFLGDTPLVFDGTRATPRELFVALAEKSWGRTQEKDLVVVRVSALGKNHGRATEIDYDLVDRFDNATGFSALERVTGIGASAASALQAASKMRPGAEPPELALPYGEYVPQLKRRGLRIAESQRALAAAA